MSQSFIVILVFGVFEFKCITACWIYTFVQLNFSQSSFELDFISVVITFIPIAQSRQRNRGRKLTLLVAVGCKVTLTLTQSRILRKARKQL